MTMGQWGQIFILDNAASLTFFSIFPNPARLFGKEKGDIIFPHQADSVSIPPEILLSRYVLEPAPAVRYED